MRIADTIKQLRTNSGYTQNQLAEKLNCNRQKIADWERGKSLPAADDLVLLSKTFQVSTDYLLGIAEIKTTDKDVQFVCEYTGLSEESIKALHGDRDYSPLPGTINFLLENWRTSWYMINIYRCFLEYRYSWRDMNCYIEEMNEYLPDRKMRLENTQEALDRSLNNKDFLNEQTINEMRELHSAYSNSKLKRDVQKLRLQENLYNILNEYCKDYLEDEQENETDFDDFTTLFISLETKVLYTQEKDGEPHGNDQ